MNYYVKYHYLVYYLRIVMLSITTFLIIDELLLWTNVCCLVVKIFTMPKNLIKRLITSLD